MRLLRRTIVLHCTTVQNLVNIVSDVLNIVSDVLNIVSKILNIVSDALVNIVSKAT